MPVYVITYDLNREIVRPNITKAIKDAYPWARLSESCYAVSTTATSSQIYNKLKPLIDENDNIYVIPLKKPHTGFGPKDVNDWLDRNLTY